MIESIWGIRPVHIHRNDDFIAAEADVWIIRPGFSVVVIGIRRGPAGVSFLKVSTGPDRQVAETTRAVFEEELIRAFLTSTSTLCYTKAGWLLIDLRRS